MPQKRLFSCFILLVASFVGTLLCATDSWAGKPGEDIGRKYTTVQRMSRERLQAAHDDVQAIQAQRQEVVLQSGLSDYRAILHAHAEDAAHTGGTLPEMLRDAKHAGVQAIFLSDHFRPPRDFMDGWRGLREGVLFVPGSETNGFLISPVNSIMDAMTQGSEAVRKATAAGEGLVFLSHIEERFEHSMEGLTGMEIYNRHADSKDDMTAINAIVAALTNSEKRDTMKRDIEDFPAEMLAVQLDYPELYFAKWDQELQGRRVVGVAANDCHHNQVFVSKMVDSDTVIVGTIVDNDKDMREFTSRQFPSIAELTKGHQPGDILARLDVDPYYVSFHNVSTHILASELSETALRRALKAGHAYVSHDWMCDPTGFMFGVRHTDDGKSDLPRAVMGDEIEYSKGLRIVAEFPVKCQVRLLKDGEVIREKSTQRFEFKPKEPGVYRIEGWLTVDDEERSWIYSNPIYIR